MDNLPIGFLKACGKPLYAILAKLISGCFAASHFPSKFKAAKMIILPKPNKTTIQKFTPEAWRPILLFNTTEKIIEAIIARRISGAAEARNLLPKEQMGNRPNKSTNIEMRVVIEAA
jgi:hypothetical protein